MRKFHDLLNEATTLSPSGYPNTGGIASDDDLPPGTTVFGDKFVPVLVKNRLTGVTKKYVPADDLGQEWNYDEFEYSQPMGSYLSYSETLDGMEDNINGMKGMWRHTDQRTFRMFKDKWQHRSDDQDTSGVKQTARLRDGKEGEHMDIKERIEIYLGDELEEINEFVVDKDDRKMITQAIMKGKPVKLILKSYDGVSMSVVSKGKEVLVSYNNDEEVTLTLVEIADSLGMEFSVSKSGPTQHFKITK